MADLFLLITVFILHYLVGLAGEKRTIGFKKSIITSILLTPLVGIIVALMYPKKKPNVNKILEENGERNDD